MIEAEASTAGRREHTGRRRGIVARFRANLSEQESVLSGESECEEDEEREADDFERQLRHKFSDDLATLPAQDGLVPGGIQLPKSLSGLRQAQSTAHQSAWATRWSAPSHPGKGLCNVDPCLPGAAFVRHIHSLPQQHAIVLSRLQLDFNDLGYSKKRIGRADGLCECGEEESRQHFVSACKNQDDKRTIF